MSHGFFTVEQWKRPRNGTAGKWVPILHLDAYQSSNNAVEALAKRGRAGLFRIVQTQRIIWSEMEDGELRLHGSHVGSRQGLARLAALYDREGGRRPVEKARRDRARAKARRQSRR
jgi:hypothetical protein